MTKNTFSLTARINAPLAYVYYAFTNKSGWMEWFAHKAYGYAKKGGVLTVDHEPEGVFAFRFTAEEANRRINFDFINLKNKEISEVEVLFEEDAGVVALFLEHREISETDFDQTKRIWEKGFENLKSVIEEGKDLRLWNRPFLGVLVEDWVSPEIAKERDLPVDHGMLLSSTIPGGGAEKSGLVKGDVISSLEGVELEDFNQFLDFIASVKAGDQVDLAFFRNGKEHQVDLTLTAYPVEQPPSNAQDLADQVEKFHGKALKMVRETFENTSQAQTDFRPGSGEWSARETLAHLVAYETDSQVWITTLVGGCESYLCEASHHVRIKALTALYPTIDEMIDEWERCQRHTVAILQELPAEFVDRKGSYGRMAGSLNLDFTRHYKEHLSQIAETLEKAANLRAS